MSEAAGYIVTEMSPAETYDALLKTDDAILIDVRTKAEWAFVGIPDLSAENRRLLLSEWKQYPDMAQNSDFVEDVMNALDGQLPSKLFFICRSGARSMQAAHAMAVSLSAKGGNGECVNVAEGFEGDLGPDSHRGTIGGWKAAGLPWRQN